MVRIGINIPNELMKRLEPLKPELNISQLCRDALARHVERYEKAIANLERQEIKTRLNQISAEEIRHRSILDVDWKELGYTDAIAWVEAASHEDWTEWRRTCKFLERQGRPLWDIRPPIRAREKGVKCFDDRWWDFRDILMSQSDEFFEWLDDNDIETDRWDVAEREYGEAWLAYVSAAWNKIQQMREDYRQILRKERLQKRVKGIEPEIPEHVLADINRGR